MSRSLPLHFHTLIIKVHGDMIYVLGSGNSCSLDG